MSFYALDYLEQGKVDFVYNLTQYDCNSLINYVRKSEKRSVIVNKVLPLLKDTRPQFCFEIIFDMQEYSKEASYILHKYYTYNSFSKDQFEKLINNSSIGKTYLEENFDSFLNLFKDDLDFILEFLFNNMTNCMDMLKKLSLHANLHIRYLFMCYLVKNHKEKIHMFYDEITKYLTSYTYYEGEQLTLFLEYMKMEDVSDLACLIFENGLPSWNKIKKFILANYEYNDLAFCLLREKKVTISENSWKYEENKLGIDEFNKDADTYFSTANKYRLRILNKYSSKVSDMLLEEYKKYLSYFKNEGEQDRRYYDIDNYGLSRKLQSYVEKYLSLSKNTSHSFLEEGSTASCYRIGDYVFKLVIAKHSYEEIICPDLYIILPNLEEDFVRNNEGIVLAGIEVQKYLPKDAKNVPKPVFSDFYKELNRLGYYTTDTLIGGVCGDNCRLLDHYSDADVINPPSWFKEYPLVLVDRDMVYKLENKSPKQLRSPMYV